MPDSSGVLFGGTLRREPTGAVLANRLQEAVTRAGAIPTFVLGVALDERAVDECCDSVDCVTPWP